MTAGFCPVGSQDGFGRAHVIPEGSDACVLCKQTREYIQRTDAERRESDDIYARILNLPELLGLLERWNDRFPTGEARLVVEFKRLGGEGPDPKWGVWAVEIDKLDPASVRHTPSPRLELPTWDGAIKVSGEGPCNLIVGPGPSVCGVEGPHEHGASTNPIEQ